MSFGVVFFLFVVGLSLLWWLLRYSRLHSLPTFDDYKRRYPQHVSPKGGVRCFKCNSSNVYLWWFFGPGAGGGPKKHICRGCGTDLYRS